MASSDDAKDPARASASAPATRDSSESASDRLRKDALVSSIATRLPMCSLDELRVVDTILERVLKLGRDSYAPLDLARDERDWSAEAAAELADTLFYLAAREVAANDRRLERLRCEAADELRDTEVVTAPHERFDVGAVE